VKPGLALFGGSFNPPHQTHRRILNTALQQLNPAEIWVIPTGLHPHKLDQVMATQEHRLQMCRLAFADLDGVKVVDLEVRREGPSYTADTLAEIRDQLPDDQPLYYLVGSDNLPLLSSWHQPERILSLGTLVTFPRADAPFDPSVLDHLGLDEDKQQELLDHYLQMDPDAVSSSDIRRRLQEGASSISQLAPAVEEYIREHHLYGS
jgi:nicotinate-nucleotide adenylyltransferase